MRCGEEKTEDITAPTLVGGRCASTLPQNEVCQPAPRLVVCPHCGAKKPASGFYSNPSKANGLDSWCRACVLKAKKTKYKKRQRKRTVMTKFNVTVEGRPDENLFAHHLRPILEELI